MTPELIIKIMFFVIPCWLINLVLNVLGFVKKHNQFINQHDRPLDGEKIFFDQERLLGKSTTILGLFVAIASGVLIEITLTSWWVGLIKGLLVYFGHAIGSFIKRRFHKKDGEFMILIDHGNYIIICGLFFILWNMIDLKVFIVSLLLTYLLHPIVCWVSFKLHLRESKL